MKKIALFIINFLTAKYIKSKKVGKTGAGKIVSYVIPDIKKFVDEVFFRVKHLKENDGVRPFIDIGRDSDFLANNKNLFVNKSILEGMMEFDFYEQFLATLIEQKIQIEMDENLARTILNKIYLNMNYYLFGISHGAAELTVFNFCVKYLSNSEKEDLLEKIMQFLNTVFSDGSDWEELSDGLGDGLIEPIIYLAKATHNRFALEKCADYMVKFGNDHYLCDYSGMHKILSLYLEAGSIAKIIGFGNEYSSYSEERYKTFVQYCTFLADDNRSLLMS